MKIDQDKKSISVPIPVFIKFLYLLGKRGALDEEWYEAAYADVADAIKNGLVANGATHFGNSGYLECRRSAIFEVDERWYRSRYPDVNERIENGEIASASAHFDATGYFEGRVPSPAMELEIEEWNRLIEQL